MELTKPKTYEIDLIINKCQYPIGKNSIVANGNRYFIVTNIGASDKYQCDVYYCRMLHSNVPKVYRLEELMCVTFSVNVYEKGVFIGTFPVDFNSIERMQYTTRRQQVKGIISTFKRKANIEDIVLYPHRGGVVRIKDDIVTVIYNNCETESLPRCRVTLLKNDTKTVLKLVCPLCKTI